MAKKRINIPTDIETELLFKNDKTCCICRDNSKGVQIHHIDNNPSNNSIDNLLVVCTQHHDEIHKSGGLTKGYSISLLKQYKLNWELTVFKKRTKDFEPLKSDTGIEKTLFEFEIRKIAFEILSLEDSDTKEINKRLEFYHSLYLLEGYTDKVLDAINQIIILPALSDKNKSEIIANRIHQFFYHLPGPHHVKIKSTDIQNIKTAIDILSTIGHFSNQFNRNKKVNDSIIASLNFIFDISIGYKNKEIQILLVKTVNKIISSCKDKNGDYKTGLNQFNNVLSSWQSRLII